MKYMRVFISVLIISVISSVSIRAADIPSKLSMADAVAIALGVNTNLLRAEDSQKNTLARLRIANFNTLFGLGASSEMAHNSEDSTLSSRVFGSVEYSNPIGTTARMELSPFGTGNNRGSIGLSLRHPLMRGKGELSDKGNLLLEARSAVAIQNKELYLTRQATILGVIEAYFRAVSARERVKVQERSVSIAEAAAYGARRKAAEEMVPEIEVSRAEIRVSETKETLNQQQRSAREALDRLMLAIGTGVGQTPELTDPVPEIELNLPTLADAIKTALENHPDLEITKENITSQARRLALVNDQLRPSLDLVAGFNYSKHESGIISGSFLSLGSMAAGFEMRLPLDKRIDLEERGIASRSLDTLQKVRDFRMEQIAEEVRNAYRSAEAARASLEILNQNLKTAENNLHIAQRMVDEGLRDNREVLEAEGALTRAANGVLAAKIDIYLASLNLKHAMGEDLMSVVTPK